MTLYTLWHMPHAIAVGRHRTRRGCHCSETIKPDWLWADQPQLQHRRALCVIQVETRMEKQAMSEPYMKHTEWNYIIWFTLIGWLDCFSKLRLTKLQTVLVNSPLLQNIGTENISLSDIFWMSVKLDRYLIKWSLGFSYAVQDNIKWNSSSTNPWQTICCQEGF